MKWDKKTGTMDYSDKELKNVHGKSIVKSKVLASKKSEGKVAKGNEGKPKKDTDKDPISRFKLA